MPRRFLNTGGQGARRFLLVRSAWVHSCGCKSRHKLVTANEAKRNCTRAKRPAGGGLWAPVLRGAARHVSSATYAVTPERVPSGVLDAWMWAREPKDAQSKRGGLKETLLGP
jgi:hypothetical protein